MKQKILRKNNSLEVSFDSQRDQSFNGKKLYCLSEDEEDFKGELFIKDYMQ